jgi:hypothetical protein
MQLHDRFEPGPQEMRHLIKEAIQTMNGSGLRGSSKLMGDLDHEQDTQGIITTKEIIFQLFQ